MRRGLQTVLRRDALLDCELIKKKAAGAIIKEEIKRLATSCDHKTMPSVWCGSDIEEIHH